MQDPVINKGTGFPYPERDRLRIRGLVPPRLLGLETQAQKVWHSVQQVPGAIEKYMFLSGLQDRNETLFFKVLLEHLEELSPIVYTPTVGEVCKRFGSYFQRPRGMYFSSADRGLFSSMVYNWPHDDVEVIVVTDGSRILGLGDLGANGMGIPIGKLALYVAAGGIHPRKVLPIMLDAGTDNGSLRSDPWYLGMTHPRLKGDAYFSIVHELVRSLSARWPDAVIQFEDFSSDKAYDIMETYRHDTLCFNDDISGTGSVCLASVLSAIRIQGSRARLRDQRIVVVGAGSAGLGVAASLYDAMRQEGASAEEAAGRFWVLDAHGLLGAGREPGSLTPEQAFFARRPPGGGAAATSGAPGRSGGGGSVSSSGSGSDEADGFGRSRYGSSASTSGVVMGGLGGEGVRLGGGFSGDSGGGGGGGASTDDHGFFEVSLAPAGPAAVAPGGSSSGWRPAAPGDWVPGDGLADGASLLQVVAAARPTVILGLTGRAGTFTEDVLREMAAHVERPIVFPLSNPTSNAECTAEQALRWTGGRALVATGSPSPPVTLPDGRVVRPSQTNNMYIFPGVGLAASVVRPKRITDRMFHAAARALAEMVTEEQLATGMVLPSVADIRLVSARVAAAVAQCGIQEGIVRRMPPAGDLTVHMLSQMYVPVYGPLVPHSGTA